MDVFTLLPLTSYQSLHSVVLLATLFDYSNLLGVLPLCCLSGLELLPLRTQIHLSVLEMGCQNSGFSALDMMTVHSLIVGKHCCIHFTKFGPVFLVRSIRGVGIVTNKLLVAH